ncbi:MAG TPA: NUDIX hydrolase [Bacteroidia bacterium]|nr:NUDIX hydrolase [Bacteroidia bacterium]
MEKNPWITQSAETVFENPWISVSSHKVLNPAGKPGHYGVVHFKNLAIGVLPLDKEFNTWLVGQWRYPLEQYSWEIPEGGGPHARPALESAQRELKEETGLLAKHYHELCRMHTSNSATDEHAIIYLATGLELSESEPEESEDLQIRKLPFEEAFQMVMRGEISDSLSMVAILKTKWLLEQGAFRP